MLRGRENRLYYETAGKMQARKINRFQLEKALEQNPKFYSDILTTVLEFNDCLLDYKLNEQRGSAAFRLSSLFLNLAKNYGVEENGGTIIYQKFSQEILGELTGLHRITVVRELKKMREQRLIQRRMPWYVIPDLTNLAEYRNQQCG